MEKFLELLPPHLQIALPMKIEHHFGSDLTYDNFSKYDRYIEICNGAGNKLGYAQVLWYAGHDTLLLVDTNKTATAVVQQWQFKRES